jgi:hypothetical protein
MGLWPREEFDLALQYPVPGQSTPRGSARPCRSAIHNSVLGRRAKWADCAGSCSVRPLSCVSPRSIGSYLATAVPKLLTRHLSMFAKCYL